MHDTVGFGNGELLAAKETLYQTMPNSAVNTLPVYDSTTKRVLESDISYGCATTI